MAAGTPDPNHLSFSSNSRRAVAETMPPVHLSLSTESSFMFLTAEAVEVKSVFNDLHDILSSHQGEMAHLARELRERFTASIEHLTSTSESIHGYLDKILEESKRLECHATQVDEIQMKSIAEFRKTYEEQSKSEAEKLIADMTSLVSKCMHRQKEMVEARLDDLKDSAIGNKLFLDGHVSTIDGLTTDLKRKWQDSFAHSESSFKENADFSAAKHCRMELLMQKCASSADLYV